MVTFWALRYTWGGNKIRWRKVYVKTLSDDMHHTHRHLYFDNFFSVSTFCLISSMLGFMSAAHSVQTVEDSQPRSFKTTCNKTSQNQSKTTVSSTQHCHTHRYTQQCHVLS